MKKKKFTLQTAVFALILIFVFSCAEMDKKEAIVPHDEQIATRSVSGWDYPIKPGTREWTMLSTHDEKLNACQIPVEVLLTMSTTELVVTCLNYPLQFDFYAYNNLKEGVDIVAANFNGLQELFIRKDNAQCLLDLIQANRLDTLSKSRKNKTQLQYGEFIVKQSLTEVILSHELIFAHTTPEQQREVAEIAINNITMKEQERQVYSRFSLESSAYLLCTTLKKINSNINLTDELELFIETGSLQNVSQIEELKQIYYNTKIK